MEGRRWLNELVSAGEAVARSGAGYPDRLFVRARDVAARVLNGPPHARETWQMGLHDVVLPHWDGTTVIDRTAIEARDPAEWLYVVLWDES